MKLYFMKEAALTYFKGNVEHYLRNYIGEGTEWLINGYRSFTNTEESPFGELGILTPQIELYMENSEGSDVENVKRLHTGLRSLSSTQATDERIWAGLAHTSFFSFMKYRCELAEETIDEKKILDNFFYCEGKKRSLIIHPLARLWWVGHLLYDENKSDPYEALEYLKVDFSTKVRTLFSSNFSNNPKIARALLIAVAELERDGRKVTRPQYRSLIRYVNLLGGIFVLDYLDEGELKERIKGYYRSEY